MHFARKSGIQLTSNTFARKSGIHITSNAFCTQKRHPLHFQHVLHKLRDLWLTGVLPCSHFSFHVTAALEIRSRANEKLVLPTPLP
jgi:hypothetical protein